MLLRVLPVVISVLGVLAAPVWAETLPVPPSLVDADTHAGEHLFLESDARQAYFPLAANFLTQKNQSYCGVASMVMVLNALQLPAPPVPEFAPYRTFTQDNVLDERTDAVLPRDILLKKGMTLDQLGGLRHYQGWGRRLLARCSLASSQPINPLILDARRIASNIRTLVLSNGSPLGNSRGPYSQVEI